jgi:tetratricopeptide (TPR) repeat protein
LTPIVSIGGLATLSDTTWSAKSNATDIFDHNLQKNARSIPCTKNFLLHLHIMKLDPDQFGPDNSYGFSQAPLTSPNIQLALDNNAADIKRTVERMTRASPASPASSPSVAPVPPVTVLDQIKQIEDSVKAAMSAGDDAVLDQIKQSEVNLKAEIESKKDLEALKLALDDNATDIVNKLSSPDDNAVLLDRIKQSEDSLKAEIKGLRALEKSKDQIKQVAQQKLKDKNAALKSAKKALDQSQKELERTNETLKDTEEALLNAQSDLDKIKNIAKNLGNGLLKVGIDWSNNSLDGIFINGQADSIVSAHYNKLSRNERLGLLEKKLAGPINFQGKDWITFYADLKDKAEAIESANEALEQSQQDLQSNTAIQLGKTLLAALEESQQELERANAALKGTENDIAIQLGVVLLKMGVDWTWGPFGSLMNKSTQDGKVSIESEVSAHFRNLSYSEQTEIVKKKLAGPTNYKGEEIGEEDFLHLFQK